MRPIAVLVVASCCALPGCILPLSKHPANEPWPEAYAKPAATEMEAYGAWTDQTESKIGQNLFPCYLPKQDGILFSSSRHSMNFKLYIRNFGDRALRRITSGPGDDLHAAVSPDGSQVAFASNRLGSWRLYLMDGFEGAVPRSLGDENVEAVHPAWSPDGNSIAYTRRSPVNGEWEIWILDLATNQERYICNGLYADFRPDGKCLAFQRHRERDGDLYAIWSIEIDGTREREIVSAPDFAATNPCWSPDGEWILFNTIMSDPQVAPAKKPASNGETAHAGGDLYRVRADGGGVTRLTFRPTAEWNPVWGSDGRIYFSADFDQHTSVWSIEANE